MLRHVNLLTWKDGTEQAALDALSAHLSRYVAEIPEIQNLSFGPDLGLAENSVDFCIVVDFEDGEAFSRYLAHPAHSRMVSEFLKPILESRQAIQFQVSAER
jgi:Stress responsive A/B Barrel Domain